MPSPLIKQNMNEKEFVIVGDGAFTMFHWMTPYIEEAGYNWTIEQNKDSYGNTIIGSYRIKINAKPSHQTTQ